MSKEQLRFTPEGCLALLVGPSVCPESFNIARSPESITAPLATGLFAAAITCSTVNPNFLARSFSGADAPKDCMPMLRPVEPTYLAQPKVDAHQDLLKLNAQENVVDSSFAGR